MSVGSAHFTWPLFGDSVQACIASLTGKRPSMPNSQVGFVRSRAWFMMFTSRPTARYSMPLRFGDVKGSENSCSPGAPASTTLWWSALPSRPVSSREWFRMSGIRR